jgi:hypothetical protein
MRLVLALCLIAAPALAEDQPPAAETDGDGFSLMQEGMKLVMRGMMEEMQPALDEMGKALEEVGPALRGFSEEIGPALKDFGDEIGPRLQQLIALIDDIKNYDAPVMLPNGDILIRRNAPLIPRLDPKVLPQPGPNGEIEL